MIPITTRHIVTADGEVVRKVEHLAFPVELRGKWRGTRFGEVPAPAFDCPAKAHAWALRPRRRSDGAARQYRFST